MRRTRIIATLLGGVLLILGACASPATPALAPATPALAPATPALAPATPALAPAPEQQAGFIVSQLRVDRPDIELGENVTVSVVVTNTRGQRGTYTTVLYTTVLKLELGSGDIKEGQSVTIETQDVTIDGGSSSTVKFNVTPEVCGDFEVRVEQLTARLKAWY